jgi:hypothetical protein
VALAEYNDVVNAFPADRTDQPFSISILPRGARRRRSIANAYRSESADKDLTISPVPVTDEIAGSLFPTACLRDLICDPFCGWMRCDAKPQNMSPAVPHDQQSIQQAKRDCRHDEHIHRSDPISVIADKGSPALRRRVNAIVRLPFPMRASTASSVTDKSATLFALQGFSMQSAYFSRNFGTRLTARLDR